MLLVKNLSKYRGVLNTAQFSTGFSDYYQVLGLPKTATQDQILSAYSRLANTFLPSVNTTSEFLNNTEAQEYREIAEAYAVLSHPESRNNYDLLNKRDSERIFGDVKDKQNKFYNDRDISGHIKLKAHEKGSYAEERTQQLAEERAKFNVNFLGRYKGGLPQKGKGPVRASIHGSALGPPGAYHDNLVHNEKTDHFPDHQNVTNEMANANSIYQGQSRYEQTRRWPAFQAKVDYDYFKFSHYQTGLRYLRNIILFFFGIPGAAVLLLKWRNAYALSKFKNINLEQPGQKVEVLGKEVKVGKRGAIKFA